MDMSLFPEHHRAFVLSGVVRNIRQGIAIRFAGLEGRTLKLIVQQTKPCPSVSPIPHPELKARARKAFVDLPYDLSLETE